MLNEIDKIATALGLFASTVKSSEEWTPQCDTALQDAQHALQRLAWYTGQVAERERSHRYADAKHEMKLRTELAAERERCARLVHDFISRAGWSVHGHDLNTLLAAIRKGEP